eukprot:CAMPEP_0198136216 /NCGR_PEP_ID=MMETSP1442-20131203/60997_1 /TAXON_ID= /ORGANISM="Craspedostauros australis, Strain CCMP3328" /LENGTH=169 /DNA_ID=CAMNT_0043797423 /DNA_START=375 /DNA_END=881 /DNA_ORIENTATION=+
MSEEEEEQFLEEAYNMSLEDPEADRHLNQGTAAPNCQPKHTKERMAKPPDDDHHGEQNEEGQEVVMRSNGRSSEPVSGKGRRPSQAELEERRKQQEQQQEQKKLSYYQMARLGYQELVNAIIRPPRADYKVRCFVWCTQVHKNAVSHFCGLQPLNSFLLVCTIVAPSLL